MGEIERGERNITFWLLCDIANALGCDLSGLVKGFPTDNPVGNGRPRM